jgi:hypothetical protein
MSYYAPPGGSLTASVAADLQRQSLSGLGISPSVNVRMPRAIPAAFGAARRYRARIAARSHQGVPVLTGMMTGMGIVTPSPNVTRPRFIHAVPPAVTFANPSRMRPAQAMREILMSGMGVAARGPVTSRAILRAAGPSRFAVGATMPGFSIPASPVDVITSPGQTSDVHRQSGIFMAPGGGYSQIPGYMPSIGPPMRRLRGLGDSGYSDPTTGEWIDTSGQAANFAIGPGIQPEVYTAPSMLTPDQQVWAAHGITTVVDPNTGAVRPSPQQVQNMPAASVVSPTQPTSFLKSTTAGMPTSLIVGVAGLAVVLGLLGGGRRRR